MSDVKDAAFRAGLDAAAEYLLACDDYGDRHKAEEIRKLQPPASPPAEALPSQTSGADTFAMSDALAQIASRLGYTGLRMDTPHEIAKAVEAALAKPASGPAGGGVTIKPLEWSCTPRLTRSIGSEPTYSIEYFHNDGGSGWELIVDEEYTLGKFEHVPLAMAKAQADYETRIRSALSSPASSSPAEAESEVIAALLAEHEPEAKRLEITK